jgi:SAM-dependent methyltransferase
MKSRIKREYETWREFFHFRKHYCDVDRCPFYELAGHYLPGDKEAIIVDIGCGSGDFATYLDLHNKYSNLFFLDGNATTVDELKRQFKNVVLYRAPGTLPFDEGSVAFIHSSHMVEHLQGEDLHRFLEEADRVLSENGILVISTPMLWDSFYGDLTHVRPYNPDVFTNYMCHQGKRSSTLDNMRNRYSRLELAYRYATVDYDEGYGSKYKLIDFIIYFGKKAFALFGVRRYHKNGFTLILQKK